MITRLIVLGLLRMQPLSGYAIQYYLQLNQTEQWAGILPGSIYHALKKLAGEGFIRLEGVEQTGNRAKSLYTITQAGEEEFQRLLREVLRTPTLHFPSALYAALNFIDDLPREDTIAALDEQITRLEGELRVWNEGEARKADAMGMPLPDLLRASFQNGREHIEADLRFLRYLRDTLPTTPPLNAQLPPIQED